MVNIIQNKDAIFDTEKFDVILVGTSIMCRLANGFQRKIKCKYPFVDKINNKTPYGDLRKLGVCEVIDGYPYIVLMYITKQASGRKCFLDYVALEKCMSFINEKFSGKRVMSSMVGCSRFDGMGDKETVLSIIKNNTEHVELTLYDYEQKSYRKEIKQIKSKIYSFKTVNPYQYEELKKNKTNILESLYLI